MFKYALNEPAILILCIIENRVMGSGASKGLKELHDELLTKDHEISTLKDLIVVEKKNSRVSNGENVSLAPMRTFSMKKELTLSQFSKKQRRLEVSAEVMKHGNCRVTYVAETHFKTLEEQEFLKRAIKGNALFSGLTGEEMNDCIMAFFREVKDAGETIIHQGDNGDVFVRTIYNKITI